MRIKRRSSHFSCQSTLGERLPLASQFPDWPGLQTIGVAVSYRFENKKKISLEMRYFISSKKLGCDAFAQAVRGHRAIENNLHRVLGVTMGEDACPIYRGDAAEILACIRHMALWPQASRNWLSVNKKFTLSPWDSDYFFLKIKAAFPGKPR